MRRALLLVPLLLAGCASVDEKPSPFCAAIYQTNLETMRAMSDQNVSWVATAISRAQYAGVCGCPDDQDEDGNRCGDRSANSHPGGAYVLCAPEEVPYSMLDSTRRYAAKAALPPECGGQGLTGYLNFPGK